MSMLDDCTCGHSYCADGYDCGCHSFDRWLDMWGRTGLAHARAQTVCDLPLGQCRGSGYCAAIHPARWRRIVVLVWNEQPVAWILIAVCVFMLGFCR